ncbi:uncharacterized protein [Nicotiana tomentosiformis]|uniref:uncharacterized protein n=1 Tax=Nicotiana tomentosiformis TaxID=4098 RepID=UPI00388CC4E9
MIVTQYEMRFMELACHAVFLVPTERERIIRFIDGLIYGLRYGMTLESEMDARFDQVIEIARCLEHVRRLEREENEVKRPRGSGGIGSASSGVQSHYNIGRPFRPAQATRHIPRGLSVRHNSYIACLLRVPRAAIRVIKAQWMVGKGCLAYLTFMRGVSANTPTVESVPVVREFLDVFPIDLSGMPSDRDIDFGIGLANVVDDDLSRKAESMRSLDFIQVRERPLAFDVQALANLFVGLDISEPSRVLACVVSQSFFLERIKARQCDDLHLLVLRCSTGMLRRLLLVIMGYYGFEAIFVCLMGEWLRTSQSTEKSYVDRKACDVAYMVGEKVLLRVSPMKGMMRFKKKRKLRPRYISPCEVLDRVGEVAYRLALSPSLSGVHLVFHDSMLWKYYEDLSYVLDFILVQLDKDLTYDEEIMSILDR